MGENRTGKEWCLRVFLLIQDCFWLPLCKDATWSEFICLSKSNICGKWSYLNHKYINAVKGKENLKVYKKRIMFFFFLLAASVFFKDMDSSDTFRKALCWKNVKRRENRRNMLVNKFLWHLSKGMRWPTSWEGFALCMLRNSWGINLEGLYSNIKLRSYLTNYL